MSVDCTGVDEMGHLVIVENLYNNEGYWLYTESETSNVDPSGTYTPLDSYYPHN
ncbi:MAG: hypothetical protein ABIF88_01410 [archaeon]